MSKVLNEQPRYGHGLPNRKSALRLNQKQVDGLGLADLDEADFGPTRFPMTRRQRISSGRPSLVSPLERFLRSRLGRRWNSVHSEISQELDNRTFSRGRNVWDHVRYLVTKDCVIGTDGKAYDSQWRASPLRGLYVHPKTGLLCYQQIPKPKYSPNPFQKKLHRFHIHADKGYHQLYRIVDDYTVLEFKSGCWFIRRYDYLQPNDVVRTEWDPDGMTRRTVYQRDEPHIKHFRLNSCRQMSKRQLRQYAELISNDPA